MNSKLCAETEIYFRRNVCKSTNNILSVRTVEDVRKRQRLLTTKTADERVVLQFEKICDLHKQREVENGEQVIELLHILQKKTRKRTNPGKTKKV